MPNYPLSANWREGRTAQRLLAKMGQFPLFSLKRCIYSYPAATGKKGTISVIFFLSSAAFIVKFMPVFNYFHHGHITLSQIQTGSAVPLYQIQIHEPM
jgi:hypothetical protein